MGIREKAQMQKKNKKENKLNQIASFTHKLPLPQNRKRYPRTKDAPKQRKEMTAATISAPEIPVVQVNYIFHTSTNTGSLLWE